MPLQACFPTCEERGVVLPRLPPLPLPGESEARLLSSLSLVQPTGCPGEGRQVRAGTPPGGASWGEESAESVLRAPATSAPVPLFIPVRGAPSSSLTQAQSPETPLPTAITTTPSIHPVTTVTTTQLSPPSPSSPRPPGHGHHCHHLASCISTTTQQGFPCLMSARYLGLSLCLGTILEALRSHWRPQPNSLMVVTPDPTHECLSKTSPLTQPSVPHPRHLQPWLWDGTWGAGSYELTSK